MKSVSLFIWLIAGLMLAASVYLSQTLLPQYPGIFFHDDSFFYLKTAYNISAGLGSTFDGINPTNGYHPLYLLLLSAISTMLPLKGIGGIVAVFLLDMLCLVVTLILIESLLQHLKIRASLRTFAIIAIVGSIGFNDFGLEVRLLLLLAWLFIFLLIKLDLEKKANLFLTGIIGGLIFLTRLDAIIFVFCTAALVNFRQKNFLKRLAFLLSPTLVFLLLYLTFNKLVYGHVATISSWLKTGWLGLPGWDFFSIGFATQIRVMLCVITSLVFFGYLGLEIRRSKNLTALLEPKRLLISGLNLFFISYLVVIILFSQARYTPWYFSLPLSISFVTLVFLVETFFTSDLSKSISLKLTGATALVMVLTALLFLGGFFAHKVQAYGRWDDVRMGHWIKDNLPEDARIFQTDNCGFTGYFSERSVIAGDGYINSWEYFDTLLNKRLKEYLMANKVRYILSDNFREGLPIEIGIPMANKASDQVISFQRLPTELVRFGRFALYAMDPSNILVRDK